MKGYKNVHKLPLPRLEFNWIPDGPEGDKWGRRICEYVLVLPIDELDIRSNSADDYGVYDEWRVFIGKSTITGGRGKPVENGKVDTPFRDYTHMKRDSVSLGNLPRYSVCGDTVTKLTE